MRDTEVMKDQRAQHRGNLLGNWEQTSADSAQRTEPGEEQGRHGGSSPAERSECCEADTPVAHDMRGVIDMRGFDEAFAPLPLEEREEADRLVLRYLELVAAIADEADGLVLPSDERTLAL